MQASAQSSSRDPADFRGTESAQTKYRTLFELSIAVDLSPHSISPRSVSEAVSLNTAVTRRQDNPICRLSTVNNLSPLL